MLNPFAHLRLRWRVHTYFARLPAHLHEDYGHTGPFTPMQVEASMDRHKLRGSRLERAYALAIFCSPDVLEDPELQSRFKSERSLLTLRGEVAGWYANYDTSGAFSDGSLGFWGVADAGSNSHCGSGHDGGYGGDCGGGHH